MGEGIGESEFEKLVPKWSWWRDKGSWFQRHGEAHTERSDQWLIEKVVGGRARVMMDEECLLQDKDIEQGW